MPHRDPKMDQVVLEVRARVTKFLVFGEQIRDVISHYP